MFAKKSHNIINVISSISVAGVTVGTMALIIVLSVFNGFESLIVSLFNTFNPDLAITIQKGKTFHMDEFPAEEIKSIPGVLVLTEVVEENALLRYREKQFIATIKGVDENFEAMSGLDTMLIEGEFALHRHERPRMILGAGVAYYLNASLLDKLNSITVYVPRREGSIGMNIERAFNSRNIFPSAVFSIQQDFDTRYAVVPIGFARDLLDYDDEVTAVEIGTAPGADVEKIKNRIREILGENLEVKNRFEQQALLYKVMQSEKWAIFLILTFILIIATFNVIGSLTMLILDKKKDIAVLHSMGASNRLIRRIFMFEGIMISIGGALLGLLLGGIISWLQQTYGLIGLGGGSGTFVVDAYPVKIRVMDFLVVFATVIIIGLLAAWYPVRQISKKYLRQKL
ncbi:MAG: FtsX-like permease family protein [Bacteroidales bacterium]